MKTQLILLFGLFTLYSSNLQSQTTQTVREQLEELNKYWKHVKLNDKILQEKVHLKTDFELISKHLSLVERYLRQKPLQLTEKQYQNRNLCLDILRDYREKGVYPKNLYHSNRTPYFIDNFGTACAVGQLIISTGHEELAKRISVENNYAYIEDMNYPELIAWADTYGFLLDELKLIQPTYGCINPVCQNDTKRDVSCYGGNDGCFGAFPTTSLSSPPFQYLWFRFDNSSNTWTSITEPCDLPHGTYKCRINDFGGNFEDIIYDIEQPDSISIIVNTTDDNGSCNGSIVVSFSGGNSPYHISWLHNSDTSSSIVGLCNGTYAVSVTDSNNCSKVFNVAVDLITGLSDLNSINALQIFPNPSSNNIFISHPLEKSTYSVVIYDFTGKQIQISEMTNSNILDVSKLQDGVYILKVGDLHQRFIKNSR